MSADPLSIIKTVASALKKLKDAVELVSTLISSSFQVKRLMTRFCNPYLSFLKMKRIFMHSYPSLSMILKTS